VELAARFNGKYGVEVLTIGEETVRSKAAYGNVMLTFAPAVRLPSVNVTLAFWARNAAWCVELRR